MNGYESFVARLRERQGIIEITIPKNVVEFGGYEDGDLVQIMMKKQSDENKERYNKEEEHE